ncbi:MAG TPA: hypothetical protein VGD58_16350 [Herpetosiphonaceae bacterium]
MNLDESQRSEDLRSFDDQNLDQGVDVTEDSPLPDIPDAGPDSQPIVPPQPVDISTSRLNVDASLVAGTFDDGEGRTLYEQAIDAYEESDGTPSYDADELSASRRLDDRRARIYDIS